MKILFLSVSTGGGHINAAKAVKEEVLSKYPSAECLIVDALKYIHPFLDKVVIGSYLSLVRKVPEFYGGLYKLSENSSGINNITSSLGKILAKYLVKLIADFSPSLIVCTHTFPLQMISYLKEKGSIKSPIVAIVTDYVNHPFWNLRNIDALVVPGTHVEKEMLDVGIPPKNIYPLGIPLSKDFIHSEGKKITREGLELDDKLTALIMGGSLGIRSVYNSFKLVMNSKQDIQIIVITGENSTLKQKIQQELLSYPRVKQNNVKIYGYTNKVSMLMDASDFIITKAGGMTISEALAKKLPIFLISPIPGQEERNTSFLVNNGAAVLISARDNIDDIIKTTILNPKRLESIKKSANILARPNASYDTFQLFEKLLNIL